ncbi:MAG: WD40 repeat protein [Myxococcota bacterium]|jgi:WD40 repeat protein
MIALLLACHGILSPMSPLPTSQQLMMEHSDSEDALQLVVQSGHREVPLLVAGSPDGSLVATADRSGLILLWSTVDGRQLKLLSGAGRPEAMEWWAPPDHPPRLVVLNGVGKLNVFSPYSGERLDVSLPENILSIAVSYDGRQLAAAASQRTWLVDADGTTESFLGGGSAVAVTSRRLIMVDRRGRLQSVSLSGRDHSVRWKLPALPGALVARSGRVITADPVEGVCAWKAESGQRLWCARTEGAVTGLLALSGNRLLVTSNIKGSMEWEAQTEVWSLLAGPPRSPTVYLGAQGAAPSGDGFVLGMTDGRAIREDAGRTMTFSGSVSLGQTVEFGGRMLLVGGEGDGQTLWDTSQGRFMRYLSTPGAQAADLSADGNRLAVAGPDGLALYGSESTEPVYPDVGMVASQLALSDDGDTVLLADEVGNVRLVSLSDTGEETEPWEYTLHQPARVLAVADSVALAVSRQGEVVVRREGWPDHSFQVRQARISSAQLSEDGSIVLLAGTERKGMTWVGAVWRYRNDGTLVWTWNTVAPVLVVSLLDRDTALVSTADARLCALPLVGVEETDCPEAPPGSMPMTSLSMSRSGLIAGGRVDGGAQLWGTHATDSSLRLVGFADDRGAPSWAVIAPSSRAYDASLAGDISSAYWVLSATDPTSLESFPLSRLKSAAYRPGLLSSYLSGQLDPIDLLETGALPQPPSVALIEAPNPADGDQATLTACITPRSGGLGTVAVRLNEREIAALTPGQLSESPTCPHLLSYPLTSHLRLLAAENRLAVLAWDETDTVAGQPLEVRFSGPKVTARSNASSGIPRVRVTVAPPAEDARPGLFVLLVGISNYPGDLELEYPAEDARKVAATIALGAAAVGEQPALFSTIDIRTLTNDDVDSTEDILRVAREMFVDQEPEDIFGIYLAGHGVIDSEGEWHFLTNKATEDTITPENALSSTALTRLLQTAPASHQAIVLDTCAAGQAVDSVLSREQALISELTLQQMKDRTGLLILAASSGDKVAYESTELGHGLLTAGLLLGLKNEQLAGLHEDYRWYIGALFDYAATKVPELAEGVNLHQRQQPVVARPAGADFHIGRWHTDVGNERSLPVVAPAVLMSENPLGDVLLLSDSVNLALSGAAERPKTEDAPGAFLFKKSSSYTSALRLWGLYKQDGEDLKVQVVLMRGSEQLASKSFTAEASTVAEKLVAWVEAEIEADHVR